MAELAATTHSRSLVITALDEHTDLDALLGAILADSASTTSQEEQPGTSPHRDPRAATSHTTTRVVATAAAVSPSTSAVESVTHVTVTLGGRTATPDARVQASTAAPDARKMKQAAMLSLDDIDTGIRTVDVDSVAEEPREPRLHEIDAFLDSRIGRQTTPGWSTFAPEPAAEDVDVFSHGRASASVLSAAARRIAAAAAALGLGVLVVWTVLR